MNILSPLRQVYSSVFCTNDINIYHYQTDQMSCNISLIESSFGDKFTNDFVNIMTLLYSDIPIVKDLKITISGNDIHTSTFLEYTKTCDEYWQNIGCEPPEFIISNDNKEISYVITDEPLEDQLNDIMINYV